MHLLYRLGIFIFRLGAIIASPFNEKARQWYQGRKNVFNYLSSNIKHPVIWVHCASLGEFEQGRPLIEAIKEQHPSYNILLTFFSPSGYEVRKNYDQADYVCYLPDDTPANAKRFLEIVNPEMVFFVKYEFWMNYFMEMKKRGIPLYMISAIFRKEQLFFKSGIRASWYRKALGCVRHFFVQNITSGQLLEQIGVNNYSVTGDTRFDRVAQIAGNRKELPIIKQFKQNAFLIVAGSSWSPDEEILIPFLENNPEVKIIFAPHVVKESNINRLINIIPIKAVRYSSLPPDPENYRVLIIDSIGLLSSIYQYADIAYIGGGFGVGIHNTLEGAIYNIPVLFGPNYLKFQEAVELVSRGIAFTVKNKHEMTENINRLINNEILRKGIRGECNIFMNENIGATEKILEKCFPIDN